MKRDPTIDPITGMLRLDNRIDGPEIIHSEGSEVYKGNRGMSAHIYSHGGILVIREDGRIEEWSDYS